MIKDTAIKNCKTALRPFVRIIARRTYEKRLEKCAPVIYDIKNKYSNKRCFIIGNGPSLKAEDLDKLKNEICFGMNGIYNIYDKTCWRPTCYCVTDRKFIHKKRGIINKQNAMYKFIGITDTYLGSDVKNACYFKEIYEKFYPELPKFSDDMISGLYAANTVTYTCLQIAAYMGFKEMFLIGIDHNYSVTLNQYGKIERHNNVIDHFSDKDKIADTPSLYKTELAYQAAKKYADEHGIKIYNATRGGKLEVFERVDFDSLF